MYSTIDEKNCHTYRVTLTDTENSNTFVYMMILNEMSENSPKELSIEDKRTLRNTFATLLITKINGRCRTKRKPKVYRIFTDFISTKEKEYEEWKLC